MPAVPYRGPAGNFYWYDIVLEQQNRPNISCANFKTSLLTLMSKDEIISAGKAISNALIDIDHILAGNKMPSQFLTIINEIRISGFLEKMLKVIPGSHIEVDGVSIECGYLNFYEDIKNFEIFSKQLEKYHFLKLGTNFRKATAQEIKDWAEFQVQTRTEHPEIDAILKQLKSK